MITLLSVKNKKEFKKTIVKMADWAIEKENFLLVILGLGSCVGVALYDESTKIGGLAHVMLPESNGNNKRESKYADTAIPFLLDKMIEQGAKRRRLRAKLVGGASMFKTEGGQSIMKIGQRNIKAVKKILDKERIIIEGTDLAEDYGRSMYFNLLDGKVRVSAFNQEDITL